MVQFNPTTYQFLYDEFSLTGTYWSGAFVPEGRNYKIDNVTINFSDPFTGTLNINQDAIHGAGWDLTFEYSVGGNVWLNGLAIPCEENDTLMLTLTGADYTGTIYSRVGYTTELEKMTW